MLEEFRFLPGGRVQAGAGSGRQVTLFNCFVMGAIDDSLDGIFRALKEGAVTMQQGGGIGYDFSTLRPAGAPAVRTGGVASGPVSFMRIWDAMCATLMPTGARRGAMMATLRCDHPDIEAFVEAKRERGALRRFNLSVLVTDAFMRAVEQDADLALVFPAGNARPDAGEIVGRVWPGAPQPRPCRVHRRLRARALWDRIMRATYDCAERGTFPLFDAERFLASPFVKSLPAELRAQIAAQGMRNSHLSAIAPTGTISLPADHVSSGIEPVFAFRCRRRVRQPDGSLREVDVTDYAYALFRESFGAAAPLPPAFVAADAVDPFDQLAMQAALQPHVDNAISKTLTVPVDYPFERFRLLYSQAYASGLKGCAAFRPNPVTGSVLVPAQAAPGGAQCCADERAPA